MGDKANTHPGAAGRATAADRPASVRNVVLVGHSGSGKTTLVEALALTAGAVNRAGRVEDGAPSPTTTRSSTGSSARYSCRWCRSSGADSRSISWTPPDTPTSSAS